MVAKLALAALLILFAPLVWLMPKAESRQSGYDRMTQAEHDASAAWLNYCPGDKL
jgi:hypothetical protein